MSKEEQKYFKMPLVPFTHEVLENYIKDAAASAPETILRTFSPRDTHLLNNLSDTNLEQKLYLCAKLGKRFAITIADRSRLTRTPDSFVTFIDYLKRKFSELRGTCLKQWGMFIVADKEIIQHLSRLSIDINPQTMYLLRNYEEIAVGIDKVSDIRLKAAVDEQSKDIVDRVIFQSYKYKSLIPLGFRKIFEVTQVNIAILFYLQLNRRRLIAAAEISMQLGLSKPVAAVNLIQLTEMGICQEDCLPKEEGGSDVFKAYQLTGYGVTVVNRIRENILSQSINTF